MSKCGCACPCHGDEGPEFPGPCAACCEPGDTCQCGVALEAAGLHRAIYPTEFTRRGYKLDGKVAYTSIVERLGIRGVCFGGCGLTGNAHRGSVFLDIVHFGERRVSKRGLRKLLLLCARRDRMLDPGFLNDPGLWWVHFYLDERKANEWAAQLGVRFPVSFSLPERRAVSLVPGLSRQQPAVWAWARRGVVATDRAWGLDDTDAQAAGNFV